MEKLTRSFFSNNALEVAFQLVGKILVFGSQQGIILETEAYRGEDDPASHAFKGVTPRSRIMFGPPGMSYVYFIYGMHYCLNITTEPDTFPSAVLIRGLRLVTPPFTHLKGPGRLSQQLGITTAHNNIDLTTTCDFYVKEGDKKMIEEVEATPRIGIKVGQEKLWRFIAKPSKVADPVNTTDITKLI